MTTIKNLNNFLCLMKSKENNKIEIAKYCLVTFIDPKNILDDKNIKKLSAMLFEYLFKNLLKENRIKVDVII